MGKIDKLISVITPCYNGEKYIKKLLKSVLNQTYPNIEMFVVDDGSSDDSAKIIKSYIPKFSKKGYSLTYLYQKNAGQSFAINKALKLVKGDYLVWPDADDYYSSVDTISEMVKVLDGSDDDVSMARVQYNIVDEDDQFIGEYKIEGDDRYDTDLFEDCLFRYGITFWASAGGYMVKMSKLDELISGRDIYTEKEAGQNFQICLPLLYKNKCLTIEENLYNIVSHDDSHSRNQETNNKRQKAYYKTLKAILKSMPLEKEYSKYLIKRVKAMISGNTLPPKRLYRNYAKKLIKGILPHGFIVILRRKGILKSPDLQMITQPLPPKTTLEILSDYDDDIFNQGFAHGDYCQKNIDAWMLFCAHVLEKAMSRVDFEEGHNIFRLEQLSDMIKEYEAKSFGENSFPYRYALSSIKEYILLHEKNGFSVEKIKNILGDVYEKSLNGKNNLSGYKILTKEDKNQNSSINFEELQNGRYSVREFSSKKVDGNTIKKAVQLATKAPSVCNRQPVKVINITNSNKIKKILKIQGGFGGYELPPSLLLITADVRSYVGENERNQGFIDGGSFAMSLLLSLEYYGLAACPLHTMFGPETDQEIKKILDISTPEYLIMFVAVGHFNDRNKVAVSSRYKVEEIMRES